MVERSRAWVAEETGDSFDRHEDPLVALGLFSVHLEDNRLEHGWEQGPQRVSAAEAIAWARERSTQVVVRICARHGESDHFSAGVDPIVWDGKPLPEWPKGGLGLKRRRLPEWEFVDRTDSDPPIDWDVLIRPVQGWGDPVAGFPEAFGAALERDSVVSDAIWQAREGGGVLGDADLPEAGSSKQGGWAGSGHPAAEARIRLSARTVREAEALGIEVCIRARRSALSSLHKRSSDDDPLAWSEESDAYPTGSWASAANARLTDGPPEGKGCGLQ